MIVWIAGWPHCGSTLLRTFLRDTFGMKVYSKYAEPKLHFAFGPESDAWANRYSADPAAALAELDEADEWYAVKTHEWPSDTRHALYVARDGRDAIGSLSRFWGAEPLSLLGDVSVRKNTWLGSRLAQQMVLYFGSWSSHWLAWDIEQRPNGLLVKFDQILNYPEGLAEDLAMFFGIDRTGRWVDKFDEYKEKWPAMYDDKDSEHRHSMPPEVEALFWRLHGPVMRELGYAKGGE